MSYGYDKRAFIDNNLLSQYFLIVIKLYHISAVASFKKLKCAMCSFLVIGPVTRFFNEPNKSFNDVIIQFFPNLSEIFSIIECQNLFLNSFTNNAHIFQSYPDLSRGVGGERVISSLSLEKGFCFWSVCFVCSTSQGKSRYGAIWHDQAGKRSNSSF